MRDTWFTIDSAERSVDWVVGWNRRRDRRRLRDHERTETMWMITRTERSPSTERPRENGSVWSEGWVEIGGDHSVEWGVGWNRPRSCALVKSPRRERRRERRRRKWFPHGSRNFPYPVRSCSLPMTRALKDVHKTLLN